MYLMNKPVTHARTTRWLFLHQEFDITIVDKQGKDNVVADIMSRLENNPKGKPIKDSIPDEYISQFLLTLYRM